MAEIRETVAQTFYTRLRGALLWPGDNGYDAASTVYNG
jgi:hypothetical protein